MLVLFSATTTTYWLLILVPIGKAPTADFRTLPRPSGPADRGPDCGQFLDFTSAISLLQHSGTPMVMF